MLSGRNATGGAVNIHTAKPLLGEFGFKQEVGAAERGQFRSRTVLNAPIGDKFAAKLAYLWVTRDDQGVKNSAPQGPDFGEREVNAWRIDLRWQSGDVTVDYAYDWSKATGYDTPSQCLYPSGAITWAAFDPRVQTFIDGCTPKKLDALYYPFDIPKNRNVVDGHTLNIEWAVSDALTIRSITGYREVDTRNAYNYGAYAGGADVRADSGPFLVPGTPFDGASHPITLTNEAFSQELQFLGDVSPTFRYTVGLYYSSEDGDQHSGPNIRSSRSRPASASPKTTARSMVTTPDGPRVTPSFLREKAPASWPSRSRTRQAPASPAPRATRPSARPPRRCR